MSNHLSDKIDTKSTREKIVDTPNPPKSVTAFLGRLNLLQGVPFAYLVPDEKLLPAESLKFFGIDPQWINAFVGGAISVGRGETVRLLLNKTVAGNYAADILHEARALRAEKRGGAMASPLLEEPGQDKIVAADKFSGFLLRSRILQAWPGLEVRAYSDAPPGRRELTMLRLDRLAPDILFGLVDDQLTELEITQPPEGLHFVIQDKNPPDYRGDRKDRVLDIKSWQNKMRVDRSAYFAKQQSAHPLRFIFKIGG
jgi:hypothetical protein